MSTITLYANQSARISSDDLLFNNHTETISVLPVPRPSTTVPDNKLFLSFSIPSTIRDKKIVQSNYYLYAKNTGDYNGVSLWACDAAFDESTIDYGDYPDRSSKIKDLDLSSSFGWNSFFSQNTYGIAETLRNGLELSYYIDGFYGTGEYSSIYNSRSSYKPYIVLSYEDATVYTKNCSPSQGYANEQEDITFSWQMGTEATTIDPITQTSAKFRWRSDPDTAYTEIDISDATTSYTLPANTVTTDSFQWQVEATASNGATATSPWYAMTTVDYLPTCTNASPIDAYVDGAAPITFKWDRAIDSGTEQTRYDLQYSTDSGATWVDLKTENIAALQSTIAADVLPAGQMTWRVRSYNSDSAAGSWSTPTAIIVQSAPAAPSISGATNAARPTVSWQAVGQQSYQVQVLYGGAVICDTGEVGSAKKTHKVTDYLANGSYAVRVRIKNVYGFFSEWAEYGFTISVAALSAPTFTAAAVAGGALVTVSSPDDYAAVYVLRDGVPVAKLTGSAWTDRHSVGEHSYTVRGIDASDNYADGTAVSVTVSVPVPEVAPADDYTGVVKMPYTSGGLRIVNKTVLPETATYYAAGRAMPVVEFGEHESVTHSFTVSYRTRVEAERLVALIGQALAYRNAECCYFAALTSFNYSAQAGCWDCGVQLTEISYVDAVEYD